jgi:hypothetical protein
MPLDDAALIEFIRPKIAEFHVKRIEKLKSLQLKKVLKRKNPYLFRAKNIVEFETLVRSILEAHLSSQEETLWLYPGFAT